MKILDRKFFLTASIGSVIFAFLGYLTDGQDFMKLMIFSSFFFLIAFIGSSIWNFIFKK